MKKTLSQTEQNTFAYLIALISSGVNEKAAPRPPENLNWSLLDCYAHKASVDALYANALIALPKDKLPDEQTIQKLNEIKNRELFIDVNKTFEIEKVLKAFDIYKIKNVPLKGYFMKSEYPRPDFRSLSDYDILFDKNDIDRVKSAFAELGYNYEHTDETQCHFSKPPYMYVEMHMSLSRECDFYHNDIKNQLNNSIKREDYEYSYEMLPEDFYLFILLHDATHCKMGGMGIRMVLDIYLYHKNHRDSFDYDYLNERLRLFKLDGFENRIRQLAYSWFDGGAPEMTFDSLETYILLSGTLGRTDVGAMVGAENMIEKAEKEGRSKSKFSFLISSVFPSKKAMEHNYPYLETKPFLLPVSWAQMWGRRFFVDKNVHIKRGIKNRLAYTDEDVDFYKAAVKEAQLTELNNLTK